MDKKKIEENKKKKEEYQQLLMQQIEESKKKKLFQGIMSEYEQKINNQDLEAYENMEAKLNSKIFGVKIPENLSHKYRSVSQTMIEGRKSTLFDSPDKSRSSKLLDAAIKTMEDPSIQNLRHNTQNKAYGYSPTNTKPFSKLLQNKSNKIERSSSTIDYTNKSMLSNAGNKIINEGNNASPTKIGQENNTNIFGGQKYTH